MKHMILACFMASSLMMSSCFAKYEWTFRWTILIQFSFGRLITFGTGSLGRHFVDSLFISFTTSADVCWFKVLDKEAVECHLVQFDHLELIQPEGARLVESSIRIAKLSKHMGLCY